MSGTVNIHGKEYRTVALRVSEFRKDYPITEGWGIETQLYSVDDQTVILRAIITDPDGRIVATGYAEEERTQRGINSTSALENGETSAIGRALAAAGFAGTEYASADEVATAIGRQSRNTNGDHIAGQPTEKQKNYAWKLIKQRPPEEHQDLINKVKGMDSKALSAFIDEMKDG